MRQDERQGRSLHTEPFYPGNGLPPRPGEDRPGLSPFGRLGKGQVLGKPSILIYDRRVSGVQPAQVDMISVSGDDLDACSLVLTLHPPRVVQLPFDAVRSQLNQQNLTGEQTNSDVTAGDFPGTDRAIQWPPLEAAVEFGIGGSSTKFVVDYVNGVAFSVVASFLRVHALVTQNEDNGEIAGTSAAYYLAAHVGPGFAEGRAQRTIFVGAVADDHHSCVFDLPKFAKVAKLIGRQDRHDHNSHRPVHTIGWIRFWQSPTGENGVGDFPVTGPQCHVEVPNAALYFSVFNESGHKMKLSVIFELFL